MEYRAFIVLGFKTSGLLTQAKNVLGEEGGGVKGWSLNTGGLKDRLDCSL